MKTHISTMWNSHVFAEMLVFKTDETIESTELNVDDITTLGYITDKTLYSVTGRVADIEVEVLNDSYNIGPTDNPTNNIIDDIKVRSITIDNSEANASSFVTINTKDIVEAPGVTDVAKVMVIPNIKVDLTSIDMVDGEEVRTAVNDVKVGSTINKVTFVTDDGNTKSVSGSVAKFLYNNNYSNNIVTVNGFVIKASDGKPVAVEFSKIKELQ